MKFLSLASFFTQCKELQNIEWCFLLSTMGSIVLAGLAHEDRHYDYSRRRLEAEFLDCGICWHGTLEIIE